MGKVDMRFGSSAWDYCEDCHYGDRNNHVVSALKFPSIPLSEVEEFRKHLKKNSKKV